MAEPDGRQQHPICRRRAGVASGGGRSRAVQSGDGPAACSSWGRRPRPPPHGGASRRTWCAVAATAPDRLRRGHPAPAVALGGRAGRRRRDPDHPLPCRPLPRPARDAEDVRPARARGAAAPVRPGRAARADRRPWQRCSDGCPTSSSSPSCAPATSLPATATASSRFATDHAIQSTRLRAGRGRAAGTLRPRRGPPAGCARGAAVRSAPARRDGDARLRRHGAIPPRWWARHGRGAGSSSRATRARAGRCLTPRWTPTSSCTRRRSWTRSASARPRQATRRRSRLRRSRVTPACGCWRSRTSRPATSGREIAAEAVADFADTVVPRDFDTIELPLPERGAPHLVGREDRAAQAAAPAPAPAG